MTVQNHLFFVDPLKKLNLRLDSSLRMANALSHRGHRVYISHTETLSWRNIGGVSAYTAPITFQNHDPTSPLIGDFSTTFLSKFSAIHMRKDPPFDIDYISDTWFLEGSKVQTFNNPAALRAINEKIAVLRFPKYCRPALLSSSVEEILSFIENDCGGDGIVKPLNLFGGQGVQRVELSLLPEKKAKELLFTLTCEEKSPRLIQAFDKAIFDGEVRAFAAFGKAISWCLKKPATGQFLANTAAGASLVPYSPSTSEIFAVEETARELSSHGIHLVGFDIINGFISEMNITSPRLLTAPGDHTDYYGNLADMIIANTKHSD